MHGLIFLQLQKFARQQAGDKAWEVLLREAKLPEKSYSAAKTYPDEEVLALVGAASRVLQLPAADVLEAFGAFIAPELVRLYGRLVNPEWKTLDVIENTEKLIHAAVRVGNPGAKPPVLECLRTTQDDLQIMYSSERQLCSLAKGIVKGLAKHFGETITIVDDACMSRGDPFCAIHVQRLTTSAPLTQVRVAMETGAGHENTPLVGETTVLRIARRKDFPFLDPPLQPDEIGRLLEYRILGVAGQGGMGIVFRAADGRLGRIVALKVLQPRFALDDAMRQRFLREARALASIQSDHIVTIFEVGLAKDLPFLAMAFLEGESLESACTKAGPRPVRDVVRIGRETAVGLAAAHERGLVHRDIKPGNLWLEAPAGRVKVLDFGLARGHADPAQISQVGVVLGTPAFMAPEQARGDAVDHRADLFSLGSVLYWLCTNQHPFKGTDVLSTLTALATQDPSPPQSLSAEVPAPLSALIMSLLQKDPGKRPSSSSAVADALAAIERGMAAAAVAHT